MRKLLGQTVRSASRLLCAALVCAGMAGAASAQTFSSGTINLLIPPGAPAVTAGTTTHQINVPSGGAIQDVIVAIDFTHTFFGDLLITLTSPSATIVTLVNRKCGSIDPNGTYTFSDAASSLLSAACTTTGGTFLPEALLAGFDGQSPIGNWTLTIADLATADIGTLRSWSITFVLAGVNRTLTVDGTGGGNGDVTGTSPSAITCTSTGGAESGTCFESVPDGTVVELTAAPAAGSMFTGWTNCDSVNDLVCTQTVSGGDETVQAGFALFRELSITGAGNGAGTIVAAPPSGINCTYDNGNLSGACGEGNADGTVFDLTATPAAGSVFGGWSGCDSVSSNQCTQTVAGGNETVQATFLRNFTISVSASPAAGGSASGGGTYTSGSSATVIATANAGFTFVNWTEGGVQVSTSASYNFTVTGNRTLVANFRANVTPGRENDLLVDFGTHGLWQFLNNATWQNIHTYNPYAVGAADLEGSGKDEAIATIYSLGLAARYNNANPWKKLQPLFAKFFVAGDFDGNGKDDLAADLGSSGIWVLRNNATNWVRLHVSTSQGLAVGDLDGNGKDELLVDFGASGLWAIYNNASTWTKLYATSPQHLATGDLDGSQKDEVVIDLGSSGIFARYNNAGGWVKLLALASQGLVTGDLDGDGKEELIADLGTTGLWARFNNATWRKLNASDVGAVGVADLDRSGKYEVIASFGTAGVFALFNNAAPWRKLSGWSAEGLAAGSFD